MKYLVLLFVLIAGCSECRPDQSSWTSFCVDDTFRAMAGVTGETAQWQIGQMNYNTQQFMNRINPPVAPIYVFHPSLYPN